MQGREVNEVCVCLCICILLANGIDNKRALFSELLKFLRCERRVIDYSESTVKSSKMNSAAACNVMSTDNKEELRLVDMVYSMDMT